MPSTHINCLLFDLDDTLYPHTSGVWDMVRTRINQYLQEVLGFPTEEVGPLRQRLWHQYGTTLRGLQEEYSVDMDGFLEYVHDVPLEATLKPNEELRRVLGQFSQRKIIFTNANTKHAQRVMQALDVGDHFEAIVDIYAMHPYCKPDIEAFHKALALINEKPGACLMIDDSPRNLQSARTLGISTVSIGRHPDNSSPHIDSILDLPRILKH